MILNKRGTSLIELLVSIVLISVVMMFMFRLLVDVTNEQSNDVYAKENQVNRAEILKIIERDLMNKTLTGISDTGSNSENLRIIFTFSDGTTSSLAADKHSISYGMIENNNLINAQRWTLDGAVVFIDRANVNKSTDEKTIDPMIAITINVEIHTNNDRNNDVRNNVLDDITISYVGLASDLPVDNVPNCLGYTC